MSDLVAPPDGGADALRRGPLVVYTSNTVRDAADGWCAPESADCPSWPPPRVAWSASSREATCSSRTSGACACRPSARGLGTRE